MSYGRVKRSFPNNLPGWLILHASFYPPAHPVSQSPLLARLSPIHSPCKSSFAVFLCVRVYSPAISLPRRYPPLNLGISCELAHLSTQPLFQRIPLLPLPTLHPASSTHSTPSLEPAYTSRRFLLPSQVTLYACLSSGDIVCCTSKRAHTRTHKHSLFLLKLPNPNPPHPNLSCISRRTLEGFTMRITVRLLLLNLILG